VKKRETVEEYLARGGKITVLPAGATSEGDGLTKAQREGRAKSYKRAGKAGQAAVQQSRMPLVSDEGF